MTTRLLNDFCRCQGAGCPQRYDCRRWTGRTWDARIPAVGSLYPIDQPLGRPCPARIPLEPVSE